MFTKWFEGACPQCRLDEREVTLLLNNHDYFECPECGLQVAMTSSLHAILLHWRGEGQLKHDHTFTVDQIEHPTGRILCEEALSEDGRPFFLISPGEFIMNEEALRTWLENVRDCLHVKEDSNATNESSGIYDALAEGDEEKVLRYLDEGADPNLTDYQDKTLLHYAAEAGSTAIAKLLLDRGARVDSRDMIDRTPLYWAAEQGHTSTARLLLERGADPAAVADIYESPLHVAASGGHADVCGLLVENGADINANSNPYMNITPLVNAVESGHARTVKLLLDLGAEYNPEDHCGYTLLHRAVHGGDTETVELLLDRGAEIHPGLPHKTPIHSSAESGDTEVLKILLDRGGDANIDGSPGGVDLGWEILKVFNDWLFYRRELGDEYHWTALHLAAAEGQVGTMELLLDYGAWINPRDCFDRTPLNYAARRCRLRAAKLLLERGADVNAKRICEWSILPDVETAKSIVEKEKTGSGNGMRGWTALHDAVLGGDADMVKLLLDCGADIGAKDYLDFTPLRLALEEGCDHVAELLRQRGGME